METIKAKKSLGQNFLIDEEALFDISSSIEITGKNIIEVGPGYGALTEYIIQESPQNLTLVELDKDMIDILDDRLQNEWKGAPIFIENQDVLQFVPKEENYSVIANIPYYITSPILFRFLYDLPNPPDEMTIMMQKEVGEKILEWRAKKPHHSVISLAMENACDDIKLVRYVWKESFDPAPKVDSIVLKFIVKKKRNRKEEKGLIALWKQAFTQPRKTLLSNLKGIFDSEIIKKWMNECGYDEKVRAEAVRRDDWEKLM